MSIKEVQQTHHTNNSDANKSEWNNNLALIQRLFDQFQHNLPLTPTPYADMATELGIEEAELLSLLKSLQSQHLISRVGAVFQVNRVGVSTLAAMAVPEERLETIAEMISRYPSVNHNYEREHHFNLWFVVTAETSEQLDDILQQMQQQTGIVILKLPMEKDYHIDLGFPLQLVDNQQSGGQPQ